MTSTVRKRTKNLDRTGTGVAPQPTNARSHPKANPLKQMLKWIIFIPVLLYISLPLILCAFPQIAEQMLFLNMYYLKNEPETLKHPTANYKLKGSASFHVDCAGIRLGVWHVLPKEKIPIYSDTNVATLEDVQRQLGNADNIIIYHHGAGMSRATGDNRQRAEIYKLFQSEGYHTIAFDYRGFGDSSGWPSELGVVNDSLCIFDWVKNSAKPGAKVRFWGHSLGASVATLAAKKIFDRCEMNNKAKACQSLELDGLILEGGFVNVRAGAEDNFFVQKLMMVYSKFLITKILDVALSLSQTAMATDVNLPHIKCPVLMLYTEDDDTIPCKHGEKLYDLCKTKHSGIKKVTFVKFKALYGYGHMDIYRAPELPKLLKDFVNGDNAGEGFQDLLI